MRWLVLLLLLSGCGTLPTVNGAPVGGNLPKHCYWVREQVANGSMSVELAEQFYSYCGPFQENFDGRVSKEWR